MSILNIFKKKTKIKVIDRTKRPRVGIHYLVHPETTTEGSLVCPCCNSDKFIEIDNGSTIVLLSCAKCDSRWVKFMDTFEPSCNNALDWCKNKMIEQCRRSDDS